MLQWIRRALAGRGAAPDAEELYRQGEAEALRRNDAAAETLFRRAIAQDGARARYHYALGCVLQARGQLEPAVECYRRTLFLDPGFVPAMINLGSIQQAAGERGVQAEPQWEEALALFRRATQLAPEAAEPWINLGFALERRVRLAESRAAYDRALAIDPSLADARFNRSLVLLAQGEFEAGWRDYEARWPATGFPRPVFEGPEWDGRAVEGKKVFIYAEQGFGDAIQFVRYVPLLSARGGSALLRCQPQLARLFAAVPGVERIVAPDEVPRFDFHCSLLSLAGLFGTRADTIPAEVPYLRPEPALVQKWRERMRGEGTDMRVGLAWTSHSQMPDAPLKSAPLEALAPLAGVPGVRYYSLQLGRAGSEAGAGPLPMVDLTGAIGDFADTAALIENLDLVISVDTAVAHLAGAMGKPVWTLLRHAADWRWYPDAPQSRWYPTMRLYRQRARGDWRALAAEAAAELRAAAGRRATSTT